jgi:hypothetical protein
MRSAIFLSTVAIALLAVAGCAHESQHSRDRKQPVQQPARSTALKSATADTQGTNENEWTRSPYMRAFYQATVATFANGPNIDVKTYEAKSFAIFREFARANGMNEQKTIDRMKFIPRRMVGIVKENPLVLKDYDAFLMAVAGPG